jgi:nicotinamide mononucleotide transporter
MNSFFDLNNIAFSALNYNMSWLELIAAVAGVVTVYLSAKEHIANWGIGLINIVLSAVIFYKTQLYSDFFLQFYFFVTGIYGWWQWARRDKNTAETVVKISWMTQKQQIGVGIGILTATVLFGAYVGKLHELYPSVFPQPAAFPYADSLIMMMSIVGNFLLTLKKVESWILWVIVDSLAPILYWSKGIKLIALEYVIFLILASFALWNWMQISRKKVAQNSSSA